MEKTWRIKVCFTWNDPDMADVCPGGWEDNPENFPEKTLYFDNEDEAKRVFEEAQKAEWEQKQGELEEPGFLRQHFASKYKLAVEDSEGNNLGFTTALEDVLEFIEVRRIFP